jgi:hypothetical protein
MTRRVLSVLLLMAGMVMLVGCGGEAPTAELQGAKQVLDDARTAGAEKFASSEFSAAEAAYRQAETALSTESEKLFKNFDETKTLIATARSSAEAARSATMTAKQRAKGAAEGAIADAATVVNQARDQLSQAPSGKGTEGDIEALRADLESADADLNAARQAVGREDFDSATARAASAKQTASQVENGVQMAVQRYNELVEKMRPWYEKI